MISTASKRHSVLVLDNELGMGGSEKLLYDFVTRFDRDRLSLGICCLKNGGYWKDELIGLGMPFYEKLLQSRFDARAFGRLARILRDRRVDLIDTYAHPNTVIFSWMAKSLGLVSGFVVNFHATGDAEGGRLVPTYLKPFLGDAAALVSLAETHRRYLVEVEGLHAGQIEVIYNGVDTNRFKPPRDEERAAIRANLSLEPDAVVLAAVASLKPIKRIDLFLESVAGVMRSRPDVHALVVGDGPDRPELEALAGRLGISDRVTFTGLRDDIDSILRASDALALTSRTEAFPIVVLEAMATGLPVVTTDVGSVRDMVEEDRSATIVPPENLDALTAALAEVVDKPSEAKAKGKRGREIVLERFDVLEMCENRQRLFERVLARDRV